MAAPKKTVNNWLPEEILVENMPFSRSLPSRGMELCQAPMAYFADLKITVLSQLDQLDRYTNLALVSYYTYAW